MRRWDPDLVAGLLGAVVCVAAAIPVLVLQARGEDLTRGPIWLWWVVFAGFVAAMVAAAVLSESPHRRWAVGAFVVQAGLGATGVLLLSRPGFVVILLVFVAALSCYIVPRWVTGAVVIVNTVVIVIATGHGGWFEAVMTAIIYLLIQTMSVLVISTQQRADSASRKLTEAHVELRATGALLAESSRSAERLRIARDLHDVLGHQLTALALELEVAGHKSAPPAADHVRRSRDIAKHLLNDVRATVADLRHEESDLHTTLEQVVDGIPSPHVHLHVGTDVQVDERQRTALVRCVQEIVTNTIRHATGATALWIDISCDESGGTVLTARDNGWGTPDLRIGNGLRGLRERVEELGGRAGFRSDAGFRVDVEVPAG